MSSIFSWFSDILKYLGLIKRKYKLLFIGLNYSGKTTLMYMLKDGKVDEIKPTLHPSRSFF
jgi:GTP-binding protein SAR1